MSNNQNLELLSDDNDEDISDVAEIVAVENLIKYNACRDESCRLKKLDNNVCPKCYKTYPDNGGKIAVVLTVGILEDDKFKDLDKYLWLEWAHLIQKTINSGQIIIVKD